MPPRFRSILLASLCSSLVMTLLNVGSLSFMQQVVDGDGLGLAPFAVLACCVGCLAPLAAALLAIWHYTREYDLSLSSGQGMIVGLWTGLAHALLTALMAAALQAAEVIPESTDIMDLLLESGMYEGMDDPDIHEALAATNAVMKAVQLFFSGVVNAVLGLVGGVWGAATFKREPAPASQ